MPVLASYERTTTRTTRPFGVGPFLGRIWMWLGDSITQANLGSVENNARSSYAHMVTNYFQGECNNIAAGARTLSSFMEVTTGAANPVAAGTYDGQWYRNTVSSEEFFWTGSVWQARKAGESGTWFVGDRRTLFTTGLADVDCEFVVIAVTGTNDIRMWVEGTGGVKDEGSVWHFKKMLERLVTEIYAVGKTPIFMMGTRALHPTFHGTSPDAPTSLTSPERLAGYNQAFREVADANDILAVDIGYIYHSEFAMGRVDINMRSRATSRPSGYTLLQWTTITAAIGDAYANNKDEVLDHYFTNSSTPSDLTLGMNNQHPNELGHFIAAQEFVRAVYEFGI
jgi:hypothetical protein